VSELADLDSLLSNEGWPHASSRPTTEDDPGRFHALFGRDSLITSLQVLPVRSDVARATLRVLAERQGRLHHPGTLEAPGQDRARVPPGATVGLCRLATRRVRLLRDGRRTSWYVVLLDATRDPELSEHLEPNWRAAADWLRSELDTGDGLIQHTSGNWADCRTRGSARRSSRFSATEGGCWRPDGSSPRPPFADADRQAITVAALRALGRLTGEDEWRHQHDAMRERVSRTFLPDIVMVDGDAPFHGAGSELGCAVGGRARPRGRRDRRRASLQGRHHHAVRPAHPLERITGLRRDALSPRLGLAVRQLVGLGRPSRRLAGATTPSAYGRASCALSTNSAVTPSCTASPKTGA
jgi:hypothetical protein